MIECGSLTDEQVKMIKIHFDRFCEASERAKEIRGEISDIKKSCCEEIEGAKPSDITLLFKAMTQLCETGDCDVNSIASVLDLIHSAKSRVEKDNEKESVE